MVTSGFYDTRYYNADQFGDLFDGIICEGVFSSIGTAFATTPKTGMDISIDSGKAWIGKRWIVNDGPIVFTVSPAPYVNSRIDAVVLESNNSEDAGSGKNGSIKIVTGSPASSPSKPQMINTDDIKQMAICYITVTSNTTAISQNSIERVVGTEETPFVSGLLQQLTITELYAELQNQMPEAIATFKAQSEQEFLEWFNNLEDQLTDNQAYNLQRQINNIWAYFDEVGRAEDMIW